MHIGNWLSVQSVLCTAAAEHIVHVARKEEVATWSLGDGLAKTQNLENLQQTHLTLSLYWKLRTSWLCQMWAGESCELFFLSSNFTLHSLHCMYTYSTFQNFNHVKF
eukprot:scpid106625/ scgid23307/ 